MLHALIKFTQDLSYSDLVKKSLEFDVCETYQMKVVYWLELTFRHFTGLNRNRSFKKLTHYYYYFISLKFRHI